MTTQPKTESAVDHGERCITQIDANDIWRAISDTEFDELGAELLDEITANQERIAELEQQCQKLRELNDDAMAMIAERDDKIDALKTELIQDGVVAREFAEKHGAELERCYKELEKAQKISWRDSEAIRPDQLENYGDVVSYLVWNDIDGGFQLSTYNEYTGFEGSWGRGIYWAIPTPPATEGAES